MLPSTKTASRDILLQRGPAVDDEPLLEIEQRIINLVAISQGVSDDDHLNQLGRELEILEMQIRTSVPRTPAGIAVKIRHLWAAGREDNDAEDGENLRTIHEALRLLEEDTGLDCASPANGSCGPA